MVLAEISVRYMFIIYVLDYYSDEIGEDLSEISELIAEWLKRKEKCETSPKKNLRERS